MTIISAAIVNKQGRILLARQFVDIQRTRIEGLLSAFPRLLEASVNKQATFLDADTVRYVYQPLDELFLVLVTSTTSNIVEDLATLHLMGRLVPEYAAAGMSEADVEPYTLQICMIFDEVVVGGKREETSVDDIQTYLLMNSVEEQNAIEAKRQQMENARRVNKARAAELREKHRAGIFQSVRGKAVGGAYDGIGSGDGSYVGFGSSSVTGPHVDYSTPLGNDGGNDSAALSAAPPTESGPAATAATMPRTAMTLGRSRRTDLTSKVQREMGRVPSPVRTETKEMKETAPTRAATPPRVAVPQSRETVHVTVEEKMSARLSRGGDPMPTEIKGELSIVVTDPAMSSVALRLGPMSADFAFRAHTRVNKAVFARDRILAMLDNKALPVNQSVTILRWRQNNPSAVQPPIVFACWQEVGSMTVEYELVNPAVPALERVCVTLPLHGCRPASYEASTGTCELQGDALVWRIPCVDKQHNRSGNVEITLAEGGQEAPEQVFFPMDIAFTSEVSVGMVYVEEVVQTDTNAPVRFSQETCLVTDHLTIE